MSLLRPTHKLASFRNIRTTSSSIAAIQNSSSHAVSTRAFSTTPKTLSGDSHGSHYDPPTGWLWGIPPGQKYVKEGWEGPAYWGICGSLIITVIAYGFKPDTSIQTWALEEARRRLEAEGILPDPDAPK